MSIILSEQRLLSITEGWTEELGPFTLQIEQANNDGTTSFVPVDLTGMAVAMILRSPNGALVVLGGSWRIDSNPRTGRVYYKPVAGDFVWIKGLLAGPLPYRVRWKVTDGSGNVVFFPNGEADTIRVSQE